MTLKHLNKALALAGLTLMLSGCSSLFEVGEPPTECPETANGGLTCTSAREVWKLSNNRATLEEALAKSKNKTSKVEEKAKYIEKSPFPGGTPSERSAIYTDAINNRDTMPAPEPIAVRENAKILRVLMNSWEDSTGRLHMPGYTYVEIEKRRWVVGRGATTNAARITPLSIRKNSLEEERKNNPTGDNGMGIIQPVTNKR